MGEAALHGEVVPSSEVAEAKGVDPAIDASNKPLHGPNDLSGDLSSLKTALIHVRGQRGDEDVPDANAQEEGGLGAFPEGASILDLFERFLVVFFRGGFSADEDPKVLAGFRHDGFGPKRTLQPSFRGDFRAVTIPPRKDNNLISVGTLWSFRSKF